MSARESSSFPIGEDIFSNRAANPSKKSNIPAAQTKYAIGVFHPSINEMIPRQPQARLQQVKKFGMCLSMDQCNVSAQNGFVLFSEPIVVSAPCPG